MIVIVHRPLPIIDFAKPAGLDATTPLAPGRYLLFKRPQPAGAKCGPIYTVGESSLGCPATWWEELLANCPGHLSRES